jgi:4-amino-4-deoxy-L-arabinose transferase-like glycosyltransferase
LQTSAGKSQFILWALLGLAALFFCFFGLNRIDFTNLDEGYYASVSFEMASGGDWVTPRLNGKPWWEKPPMLYWAEANAFRLFGYKEWAGRLPSALAVLLTIIITVYFATRWFNLRVGLYSGATLLTALYFLVQSHLATTDGLLMFFLTLSFCSLWEFMRGVGKWWLLISAIACGLAVLTKGPVALVFLVVLAVILYWRTPDLRAQHKPSSLVLWGLGAAALFLIVVLPWYIAVIRQHGPGFTSEFLIRQNLGRFSGGDAAHNLPFWGMALYFFAGFFPWSLYIIPAAIQERGTNNERFLWSWFLLVFVVFSISSAKLPSYLLPLYPAAAILIGRLWAYDTFRSSKSVRRISITLFSLFSLITAAFFCPKLITDAHLERQILESEIPKILWLLRIAFAFGAVMLGLSLFSPQRIFKWNLSQIGLLGFVAILWTTALIFAPAYNERTWRPVHSMVEQVRPEMSKGAKLVLFNLHPAYPSAQFYARHAFEASDKPDEISRLASTTSSLYIITKTKDLKKLGNISYAKCSTIEDWTLIKSVGGK